MFGICFGDQALAKALGGEVIESPTGWSLGTVAVHICATAPWMTPARDALNLYAVHNEIVARLPEGATAFAETDRNKFAGFYVGDHILTTQHHPEMTSEFVMDVVEGLASVLDPAVIERARESLATQADSDVFAEWISRFFEAAQMAV